MDKIFVMLLMFLLGISIALSANISVGGTISDKSTEEPLIGATVC